MNRYMDENWWWIGDSHGLRDELLGLLTDADLAFSPGGENLPLGALFRQMGEIEHSYLQALKTLTQNWDYRNAEPGLDGSVARLLAWFHELDADVHAVVSAFSDADLDQTVVRASGFKTSVEESLDIYVQAVLIFLGKAVVYLRAMGKPIPESVQEWTW
jgi:hypothetical protein